MALSWATSKALLVTGLATQEQCCHVLVPLKANVVVEVLFCDEVFVPELQHEFN